MAPANGAVVPVTDEQHAEVRQHIAFRQPVVRKQLVVRLLLH